MYTAYTALVPGSLLIPAFQEAVQRAGGSFLPDDTSANYAPVVFPDTVEIGAIPSWRGHDLLCIVIDGQYFIYDDDGDDVYRFASADQLQSADSQWMKLGTLQAFKMAQALH